MSIIWHKVWRDLWRNKFRTVLIVLSTAVGVFALGFVYGGAGVMRARMTESQRASLFPNIIFYTSQFDQDVVDTIGHESGVADAEGQSTASIRWKLDGDTDWRDGDVIARANYEKQQMDIYTLLDGDWPEGRALDVERLSAQYFHVSPGADIIVEFGRGERRLPIEGIARVHQVYPPQFGGNATFFATEETLAWLTDREQGFNQLGIMLDSFDKEEAEKTAAQIQDRLERMGVYVGGYQINDPQVHWAQDQMDSILLIMKVLGGLSLGLSGFLIVNMMNAIIAQQIWQIGVMKVIGATRGRVVRVYLAMATLYGLLSLFLAVPLGAIAANLLANVLLGLLNIIDAGFQVVPSAVGIQIMVGLAVPLLAALIPVIGGARITPHQAIGNYGLGAGFGSNWLDRLVGRIRRLPRPLTLSMRNSLRRKSRVALTLITLILGGVMFLVIVSLGSSMRNTIQVLINDFGFDVLVVFDRMHRVPRLIEAAESVDGVKRAEVWDVEQATLETAGGEGIQGQLWGIPDDSEVFHPRIVSGRALLPQDGRAILLNNKIAVDENIHVGDTVTMTIGERELTWTVVGLILNINDNGHDNFVPFDTLTRETGSINRGAFVMMMTDKHDAETHRRIISDLRAACSARRLKPVFFQTGSELRKQTQSQFDIVIYLMLAMAVLAALVGGVGLMSTMTINVVERTREIGVMRAIGASSAAIMGIFIVEGVMIGVLSWLIAAPLSYPGARLFSQVVGRALLQSELDFDYSIGGTVGWLVIVVLLSAAASLWPAWRATRVSVRESLAYE